MQAVSGPTGRGLAARTATIWRRLAGGTGWRTGAGAAVWGVGCREERGLSSTTAAWAGPAAAATVSTVATWTFGLLSSPPVAEAGLLLATNRETVSNPATLSL